MTEPVNIIIDLETLGLRENTVVLSLGAVAFKLVAGQINNYSKLVKDGFYCKFDAKEQLTVYKRTTTESTMQWWKGQSAEAKEVLKPTPIDWRMADGLNDFNSWLQKVGYDKKNSYVWSRGTYFDFPKLEHMYEQAGIECGYNGWKIRDTRTYIDILTGNDRGAYTPDGGNPAAFVHHNALHDAALDGYRMIEIFNKVNE